MDGKVLHPEVGPGVQIRGYVKDLLSWTKGPPDTGTVMRRPRRNPSTVFPDKVAL
jgi:hypothetical protein